MALWQSGDRPLGPCPSSGCGRRSEDFVEEIEETRRLQVPEVGMRSSAGQMEHSRAERRPNSAQRWRFVPRLPKLGSASPPLEAPFPRSSLRSASELLAQHSPELSPSPALAPGRSFTLPLAATLASLSGRARLGNAVQEGTETANLLEVIKESVRASIVDHDIIRKPTPCKLSDDDFKHEKSIQMSIDSVDYTCKAHAPQVFRQLRNAYKITDDAFLDSLCPTEANATEISTVDTGSKSGQKFFVSHDGRYFMKTMPALEAKRFLKVLPQYYAHMSKHTDTLLCRFLGLLELKTPAKMYLLIMSNVLDTDRVIHERYDVKGSIVGRAATWEQKMKPLCILKDFDFLTRAKKIEIGSTRKQSLLRQLKKDCAFLQSMGMMDYSLLIGVHRRSHTSRCASSELSNATTAAGCPSSLNLDSECGSPFRELQGRYLPFEDTRDDSFSSLFSECDKSGSLHRNGSLDEFVFQREPSHVSFHQQDDGGLVSKPSKTSILLRNGSSSELSEAGDEIYYIGVIDYLQQYDTKKRAESLLKGAMHDSKYISCVDPAKYSKRFLTFVETLIE